MFDAVSGSMSGSAVCNALVNGFEAAAGDVLMGRVLDSAILGLLGTVPDAAAGGAPPDWVSNAAI